MREHLKAQRRAESYIAATEGMFENHVLPSWGTRDVATITRGDVSDLLGRIFGRATPDDEKGKSKGRRRGGPIAANRALAAIRKFFNWALDEGIVEVSPAARMKRRAAETRRERTLAAEELKELWPQFGALPYPYGPFFKMVLVTGQRRDEVATMRLPDIDESERTWTIPARSTKAKRAHVVPLSPLALEILAECKAALPERPTKTNDKKPIEHIFTISGVGPITGYGHAKARLDEAVAEARAKAHAERRAEGKPEQLEPWTIHDLRRTCATNLGRLGILRLVVSKVLNHADAGVTSIYDRHEYLAEKRHALEAWAAYLGNLVAPLSGNVLPLHR